MRAIHAACIWKNRGITDEHGGQLGRVKEDCPEADTYHFPYATLCDRFHIRPLAPESVEPADAKGSAQPATVTVTVLGCWDGPVKNYSVELGLEVVASSGGHSHDNNPWSYPRPKGTLSPSSGITGASGQVNVQYMPPPVSGTYKIYPTCVLPQCDANEPGTTTTIDVKVPDLVHVPNTNWYGFIGANSLHPDNHYLTIPAAVQLELIAETYAFSFSSTSPPTGLVLLNDASLVWGGLFDAGVARTQANSWKPPHHEHRKGTVVDIRANEANGAIPPSEFNRFEAASNSAGSKFGESTRAEIHCSYRWLRQPLCIQSDGTVDQGRHYHLRLTGRRE